MALYSGIFLLALATLAFEICLARLLSVITFYHLSFFAVSAAMLGLAAGGLSIYLRADKQETTKLAAQASIRFALSIPVSLSILCLVYLLPFENWRSAMTWIGLLVMTGVCVAPFYYSGQGIACVLTRSDKAIGRLYAADLLGASLGCLLVLLGLDQLDAPSLMLICSSVAGLAALCFLGWKRATQGFRFAAACFVFFLAAGLFNAGTPWGLRPLHVKGSLEIPGYLETEKWSALSRTGLSHLNETAPYYWGPAPRAPQQKVQQRFVDIDGLAGSPMYRMSTPMDLAFLGFDVTNAAYYLRKNASACVIGVGGGRDIQSALLFGHRRVVGVDVNPAFKEWHENEYRDFSGIGANPEVELVSDEGRSYLSRSQERFSVIQMSVVDTWASSAAGAYSLSENSLYTLEAWRLFYQRLTDDGILTVSRWHSPEELGETGRIVSLAMATLMAEGVSDPSKHIALFSTDRISNLLFSRSPFSEKDIARMREVARTVGFSLPLVPDTEAAHPLLAAIVAARTPEMLNKAVAEAPFNLAPPTDEDPYFFNMLKFSHLNYALSNKGVINGNLMATLTLLGLIACLAVFCVITILVPVISGDRAPVVREWSGPLYFSLIGIGFMLVEIGLLQRLSLLLGHPIYALGVLLFGLILSTSAGSFFSEKMIINIRNLTALPLLLAALLLVTAKGLSPLVSLWITADITARVLASLAVIVPIGFLLGFFFPLGMRTFGKKHPGQTPWYWALNGCFGVLSSALAVLISIYIGVSVNFYLAAVAYAALAVLLKRQAQCSDLSQ